jgi:hypothetical protein
MKEGLVRDDYLILFDELEVATVTDRYAFSRLLPGYQVLGLCGWEDFIVRDSQGKTFSIPTVPLHPQYLAPYIIPEGLGNLSPDAQFAGRIKWYVKPVVFGGDSTIGENVTCVSLEEHTQLVRWWNDLYRSVKNKE